MPRNGSGVMVRETPVATGTTAWLDTKLAGDVNITTVDHDFHDQDLADALTSSIAVDGQSVIMADIPLNNHKITGLANGVAATDAAAFGQIPNAATILIQTQTISSAVSSVSFTGLSSTYSRFIIEYSGVLLSNNTSSFQVRVQANAAFQTTGYFGSVLTTTNGTITNSYTNNGSALVINSTVSNADGCNGTVRLLYPVGSASSAPKAWCQIQVAGGGMIGATDYFNVFGSGVCTSGGNFAVTGFQFLAPGATLTAGTFTLYGVTH